MTPEEMKSENCVLSCTIRRHNEDSYEVKIAVNGSYQECLIAAVKALLQVVELTATSDDGELNAADLLAAMLACEREAQEGFKEMMRRLGTQHENQQEESV